MFVANVLSHRLFLLVTTLFVTVLTAALMWQEVALFLAHADLHTLHQLKESEESIAILFVGFGMLLEGRHILQEWAAKPNEVAMTKTTEGCEYYGFVLLAFGLFIEMVDQALSFVDSAQIAIWLEILINYPMNIYGLYLLVRVMLMLANSELDNTTVDH